MAMKEEACMIDESRNVWRLLANSLSRAWVPPMAVFFIGNLFMCATGRADRCMTSTRQYMMLPERDSEV